MVDMKGKRMIGMIRVLVCAFVFLWFLTAPGLWADVSPEVEPTGELMPGTTLTVRLTFDKEHRSAVFYLVKDVNNSGRADEGDKVLIKRKVAPVKGSDVFRMDIHLSPARFEPGRYIVRAPLEEGEPAEGKCFVVVKSQFAVSPFLKALYKGEVTGIPPLQAFLKRSVKKGTIRPKSNICLLDAASMKTKGILTDAGDCTDPCWSADGKRIVYVRGADQEAELWMMTIDDEGRKTADKRLPGCGTGVAGPACPVDGGEDGIAFLREGCLYVADADGSAVKRIGAAIPAGHLREIVVWSKAAGGIIAAAERAGNVPILDMDGNLRPVKDNAVLPEEKMFPDVWRIDPVSGEAVRLPWDNAWFWLKYLSADGKKLVFPAKGAAGNMELWERQGKNFDDPRLIIEGRDPLWLPTGKWIVFVSEVIERKK